jgi:Ca2+-binding RTX toxin-like protein
LILLPQREEEAVAAEYYVNRPAEPPQINHVLAGLIDKVVADLLSGTATSRTLKVLFQHFGPAGAANEIQKVIARDGDFIVIDAERFAIEQITHAAIVDAIMARVMIPLLTPLIGAPFAYAVGAIAAVGSAVFLWHNFIKPPLDAAEAYFGTAPTRLEAFGENGTAIAGVLHRGGLGGMSEVDAAKYLLGFALHSATVKPAVGSHIDVMVNDARTTGFDILDKNVVKMIADPLGTTVAEVLKWSWAQKANGQPADNKTVLVPYFDQFTLLSTDAKIALKLARDGGDDQVTLGKSAISLDGKANGIDATAPVVAAFGTAGADTISFTTQGKVYACGGLGADTIRGGNGDDVLWGDIAKNFKAGETDEIRGGRGNDQIFGGGGGDRLFGEEDDDRIWGHDGNDTVEGGSGDDTVWGGLGEDTIRGGTGADTLTAGSDGLETDRDKNTLYGEDGRDLLVGSAGNDTFYGGRDGDFYRGFEGADTFNIGPQDRVANLDRSDHLVVNGVELHKIKPLVELREFGNFPRDGVRFGYNAYVIGSVADDEGTLLINTGKNLFIIFGDGNVAVLQGYKRGDVGIDVPDAASFRASPPQPGSPWSLIWEPYDRLLAECRVIEARLGADVDFRNVDLRVSAGTLELLKLIMQPERFGPGYNPFDEGVGPSASPFRAQLFNGGPDGDTPSLTSDPGVHLVGGTGHDLLDGTSGDDAFEGLRGSDVMFGNEGSDTYVYRQGDGPDLIGELSDGDGAVDRILLPDLMPGDVVVQFSGSDLFIEIPDSGDRLTVLGQFAGTGIEEIEFADGTIWDAAMIASQSGIDVNTDPVTLRPFFTFGFEDAPQLYSGRALLGAVRDDDQGDILSVTDVFDVINGEAHVTEFGSIVFTPDPGYFGFAQFSYMVGDGRGGFTVVQANVFVLNSPDAPVGVADTAEAEAGVPIVITPLANDTDVDPGDVLTLWDATVVSVTGTPGVSAALLTHFLRVTDTTIELPATRLFEGLAPGAVVEVTITYQMMDSAFLEGGSTVTLTMTGGAPVQFTQQTGTEADEVLDGTMQADRMDGLGGADVISGGDGNDDLFGGAGADLLDGSGGDDRIIGGADDDQLTGGAGSDEFVLSGPFGHDVIADLADATAFDWITLSAEHAPDGVSIERSLANPDTMVLRSGANSVTIADQWGAGGPVVDAVAFADGSVWTAADMQERYLAAASTDAADAITAFNGDDLVEVRGGNDTVQALAGDDEVHGGAGDDDLDGGAGFDALSGDDGADVLRGGVDDDVLAGGAGDDVYVWTPGDGFDEIEDGTGETNAIELASVLPSDVSVGRDGEDLILRISDEGGILVHGQWTDIAPVISEVRLDDGTTWSAAELQQIYLSRNSTAGSDSIAGFETDDVIDGGGGNDFIEGAGGHDILRGGAGSDFVLAGLGNDFISGGGGDDSLAGDEGTDRFDLSTLTAGDEVFIYDFDPSAEKIVLRTGSGLDDFSDLMIQTQFGQAVITLPNGAVVTLAGVADTALSAANFLLIAPGEEAPINLTPVAAAAAETHQGAEDTPYTGSLLAGTDANGDTLTFALVAGSATGGTVVLDAGTGAFTFTPDADFSGEATFQYRVNDGELDSAPKTVAIALAPVNDGAPGTDPAAETAFGNEDTVVTGALLAGIDVDGDAIQFHLVAGSAVGGSVAVDADTGTYVFTPDQDFSGDASFRYRLNDGFADSEEKTVTVSIAPVNDAPVTAVAPEAYLSQQGQAVSEETLLPGSDTEGESYTYQLVTSWYGTAEGGTVSIDPVTGAFTFTPAAGFEGEAFFAYNLFDGQTESAPKTVTITVEASGNSAPDGAMLDGGTVIENAAGGTVVGTVTGTDPDAGDVLTYSLADSAGGRFAIDAQTGVITVAEGAVLDFEEATSHSIRVSLADHAGLTFEQLFAITVGNVVGSTLTGTGGANSLVGTGEEDTLNGLGGNDTLDGRGGPDVMIGGTGNDTYYVGHAGDVVIENEGEGTDTVRASLSSYALAANVERLVGIAAAGQALTGNGLANIITGGDGADAIAGDGANDTLTGGGGGDVLDGGEGNDTLTGGAGADVLRGGSGNDTYNVEDADDVVIENADEGVDTVRTGLVSYTLTDHVDRLTGTAASGQVLTGNALANILTGGAGDDALVGGDGNDTLIGGLGADLMQGGTGNDSYTVDETGDVVVEGVGEGTDTARTGLSNYQLGENVENLLATSALGQILTGNALANAITGGGGNDSLIGGEGNDSLSGGLGADTMVGGAGNDTYTVEDAGDVVVELADEGVDTVRTTLSTYTLGANVERLTGIATTGQILTGNGLANIISGGAGDDVLAGGDGNDTLNGGTGADRMRGGAGDDTYTVDDLADLVIESAGAGIDTVRTTLSTYTLGADFENLIGTVATGQTLNGNELANRITGGGGQDAINGAGGNDVLIGGIGNDVIHGGDGKDTLNGGGGADRLSGDAGNDTVIGGTEDDVIVGGSGDDRLTGGGGDDVFVFSAGFGRDVVVDFSAGAASDDVIEFHDGIFADFAAVMAAATTSGNGTVITLDSATKITLQNVARASLHEDDFVFM